MCGLLDGFIDIFGAVHMVGDGFIDTFGAGHMVDFTYGMTLECDLAGSQWIRCGFSV